MNARASDAALDRGRIAERYVTGGENVTFEQLSALMSRITRRPPPRLKLSTAIARLPAARQRRPRNLVAEARGADA